MTIDKASVERGGDHLERECPRTILKRALAKAAEMGYGYNTGPDLELQTVNGIHRLKLSTTQ